MTGAAIETYRRGHRNLPAWPSKMTGAAIETYRRGHRNLPAGHFRWPRRSFQMAAPVILDGRAGHFRWPRRQLRWPRRQLRLPHICVPMKHSRLVSQLAAAVLINVDLIRVDIVPCYSDRTTPDIYGWPFLSIPRTLTATSNFEVDGVVSISSTSKIQNAVSNVILYFDVDVVEMKPPTRLHQIFEVDEIEMKPSTSKFEVAVRAYSHQRRAFLQRKMGAVGAQSQLLSFHESMMTVEEEYCQITHISIDIRTIYNKLYNTLFTLL